MAKEVIKTEAAEKVASVKKQNLVKLKALIHLSGHYNLAWSEGQTFECDAEQAKELVENKAAELVK